MMTEKGRAMGRQPRATPDFSLLKGVRAYQPYRPEPEHNPPQSVSGVVPFQQAAPEPISDDSGARDCLVWYDNL